VTMTRPRLQQRPLPQSGSYKSDPKYIAFYQILLLACQESWKIIFFIKNAIGNSVYWPDVGKGEMKGQN